MGFWRIVWLELIWHSRYAWSGMAALWVAIVDVDYHHGNGTQQIFYDRGDVLVGAHRIFPLQDRCLGRHAICASVHRRSQERGPT